MICPETQTLCQRVLFIYFFLHDSFRTFTDAVIVLNMLDKTAHVRFLQDSYKDTMKHVRIQSKAICHFG